MLCNGVVVLYGDVWCCEVWYCVVMCGVVQCDMVLCGVWWVLYCQGELYCCDE